MTRRAAGLGKAEWRPAEFWREESDALQALTGAAPLEASVKTAAGVFKVLRCGQRDRFDGLAKSAAHVVMIRAVEIGAYGLLEEAAAQGLVPIVFVLDVRPGKLVALLPWRGPGLRPAAPLH